MEFIGDLDGFQAEKPSNWLVQSYDDPDFQAGLPPTTIGRTNPSVRRDNCYPAWRSWPDLRLFGDVGWLPILSEFSLVILTLHTVLLYGALLNARDETRR